MPGQPRLPKPLIGISIGDPSGIGPEVTLAALRRPVVRRALTPVVFGDASLGLTGSGLEVTLALEERPTRGCLVAVTALAPKNRVLGKPTLAGGRAQLAYVDVAIEAAKRGWV